ncbi:MAG: hypothetical protein U9Q67_04320, partial [Patescibacteria group bacterium]|nr:hypothetical protein [Patescibacteria group bacterium]
MSSTGKKVAIIGCVVAIVLILCCSATAVAYYLLRDKDGPDYESPKFDMQLGEEIQSMVKDIGTNGGKLEVTDSSDPLYGAKIEIPENHLDETEEISLGHKTPTDVNIPEDLNLLGDVIVLDKSSERMFLHPVSVTLPYDTSLATIGEAIGVYEYDEETGTIQATTLVEHDAENGTIQFLTTHFSTFLIIELEKLWSDIMALDYDTGFRPKDNGWFIKNWGAYITDNGNCLGMSAVSQYIYSHQSVIDNTFYEVWREGDKDDQKDDVIANELAARVQMSLVDRWNSLAVDLNRFDKRDQPDPSSLAGQAILMNFLVTEEPQVLYVMTYYKKYNAAGEWEWATANHHAILTYKYENGKFAIYDPNYPYRSGSSDWEKDVTYTWADGFGVYSPRGTGGYNYVRHIGPNLVTKIDIISKLITKAKAGFPDDDFPEITFTSPEEDEVITEKSVVVSGTISGMSYLLDADENYIHWYYQNEEGGLDHL